MGDETRRANFDGFTGRGCGDHRTVGPHRAWCFDCGEWCSPDMPCEGCEAVAQVQQLSERAEQQWVAVIDALLATHAPHLVAVWRSERVGTVAEHREMAETIRGRAKEDGQ